MLLALMPLARARAQTARPSTDTGATINQASLALTAAGLPSYAAVSAILWPYLLAHQPLLKTVQTQSLRLSLQRTTIAIGMPDYSALLQRDSAMAILFIQHHMDPAHFAATQQAVWQAIWAVLQKRPADSTIVGKNMTFVQAHRTELVPDWTRMRQMQQIVQHFMTQSQQVQAAGGQGGPGTPGDRKP